MVLASEAMRATALLCFALALSPSLSQAGVLYDDLELEYDIFVRGGGVLVDSVGLAVRAGGPSSGFVTVNDLPTRASGRIARGSAPNLDNRIDLRQPLFAEWQLDTEATITLARMGETLAVATFGGPIEVRVRPGAVTVGDVELKLGGSIPRWYEVDNLIGTR